MNRPKPVHRSSFITRRSLLDDVCQVAEREDGARLVVGDRDAELLLDPEEDGQRVERVDPGVGERGLRLEQVVGHVLLLPDDCDQLLFDLSPRHGPYDSSVFRWFYPTWFLLCAILFSALGGLEDPSRPKGRILSIEAGQRARAIATERGMRGFEVVHVARARRGEGGAEDRWVVLLDKVPHTRLREAVVIEVRATDGTLLNIRRPR